MNTFQERLKQNSSVENSEEENEIEEKQFINEEKEGNAKQVVENIIKDFSEEEKVIENDDVEVQSQKGKTESGTDKIKRKSTPP